MAYEKISITLEPKVAAELREVAGKGGLSAFVNDAVRLRALLDEMEAEAGPIPSDVRDKIDALPWPD